MAFFTPEQIAILSAGTVRVAWGAEAFFKSETVRRWAGDTELDFAGRTWLPTYGAVQIEGLGFDGGETSRRISMTLSGLDPDLLPLALSETGEADQQPISIYLILFNDTWQPVGGLIPVHYGLMQPPTVDRTSAQEGQGAIQSATLSSENMMFNRAFPANGWYGDRDQNHRASTPDRSMEHVPSLVFKTIRWPDF
ncbi:MAG: hypothetical protein DI629_12065 [Mesorhizobium amorphae]|nr:MAG: hypothetical protein DI629_12065 [Mesorhizobium amorphae]